MTEDEAKTALEKQSLKIRYEYAKSETSEKGKVIGQSIASGTVVSKQTEVIVTIGEGNEILTCPFVRLQADRAVLYTPIIGKLLSTVYTSRFASAFAVLYGSGIGILDAMHTVGRVMGNSYVEKGLVQVAVHIQFTHFRLIDTELF